MGIRHWARREGWELELINAAGTNFDHLLERAAAWMVLLHVECVNDLDEVRAPGHVPTSHGTARVRVDAAKHVVIMMAQPLTALQTEQQARTRHAVVQQEEASRFARAAEANRHWDRGGRYG